MICTQSIAPLAVDAADVSQLWESFFVSRDEGIRNKLLVHYLPLARGIARHVHAGLPAGSDFDDISQAAALGMRDAIGTFDPSHGIKFEHYCGRRVRGAALDFLRSLDSAPRMLRSRLHRVHEMAAQMQMQTGAVPSDEHLSEALNMPLAELQTTRHQNTPHTRVRMNADDDSSKGGVNLESLADENAIDPEQQAQRNDLREFLAKGLGRVERMVVMLYYYDSMSFREIGQTLDLCESRVSQIHQSVLVRLRERGARMG